MNRLLGRGLLALVLGVPLAVVTQSALQVSADTLPTTTTTSTTPLQLDVTDPTTGSTAHILATPDAYANAPGTGSPALSSGTAAAASGATSADSTSPLVQGSGPVMVNPTNYVIFWQPTTGANTDTTFNAGYKSTIQQFLGDVGGTDYLNIETQYGGSLSGSNISPTNTSTFGGMWVDQNAYPGSDDGSKANPLSDSDMQQAVKDAIAANPTWQAPGLTTTSSTMYFVFTGYFGTTVAGNHTAGEPVHSCMGSDCFAGDPSSAGSASAYCAYHSHFSLSGADVIYSSQPYDSRGACYPSSYNAGPYPNGNDNVDITLSAVSHEMMEANTDPDLGNWRDATGDEIGDKCAYHYPWSDPNAGPMEPDGTDIVLKGDPYEIQTEWSNAAVQWNPVPPGQNPDAPGCVKRFGHDPVTTATPSAFSFGTVNGGTSATTTINISDNGLGVMNILNVRLATGSDPRFSLINPPVHATIQPGQSAGIQVRFAPNFLDPAGPYSASLIVDTDDPQPVLTTLIPLSGVAGTPNAVLSPNPLNLGLVCRGTTGAGLITATNTGTGPLTMNDAGMGFGSSPYMSVLPSSPLLPQTIAPSDTFPFTVDFSPPANSGGGAQTGTFVLDSDAPTSPTLATVNATIGTPTATLDNSSLDFGGVATDDRTSPDSVTRTLTVSNTGPCNLTLDSFVVSGANAGDFVVTPQAASLPATIPSGGSITATVTFNPSAPGARSATVTVNTDDPVNPALPVSLSGVGLVPAMSAAPAMLVFPPTVLTTQVPGYLGTQASSTVTNTGQAELIVDSITTGAPFSTPAAGLPPNRYAPNTGFTVPVTFGPTAVGKTTGSVSIMDNGNGEAPVNTSIPLCGEGVNRGIRLLVVNGSGVPYPTVGKIHLQSHGTSVGVNLNLSNLNLVPVTTSCVPGEQMQYQNQTLPAAPGTVGGKSSSYSLSVSVGGKSSSLTFTLGTSEFKTLVLTVK
jgi:HYDIN/CFA65/VesB-like, Ig-like domain